MTNAADLPEPAAAELNWLLSNWATTQRLDARQSDAIRANVLATTRAEAAFDSDWLWSLLRPVTSLMERANDERGAYVPYLQLA
jgi:hypothetical protein